MNTFANYIFDCDGVILDSNRIKGDAFYEIGRQYSLEAAEKLLEFHQNNGGVTRSMKLGFLFKEILELKSYDEHLVKALANFQYLTLERLKKSNLVPGFLEYLLSLPRSSKKWVISASLQEDLNVVMAYKKLDTFFDGIYGGPNTKEYFINKLKLGSRDTLFFGDSLSDYNVAMKTSCNFIFISGYTELKSWREWVVATEVENFHDFILLAKHR